MRKIKSAPANICEMSHKKKTSIDKPPIANSQSIVHQSSSSHKISNINKTYTIIKTKFINNSNKFINNSNKIKNTLNPGLASDFITENFNSISREIGYNENLLIEFVNNFVNKKLNIKNLEIFILSLMVRYVINHAYHDILIKIKEFIMIN